MAIYKKINGKDVKLASNPIIYHNDLACRDSMNCHPISAIRNLPEKLTSLKNKSAEIEQNLADEIERATTRENQIENKAKQISLSEQVDPVTDKKTGKIILKRYGEEGEDIVQGGFLPDEQTITLNNDNELVGKAITGTFTKDSQSITETYDAEDIYDDIEATKSISLAEGQNGTLVFTDYNGQTTTVQGGYLPDEETIELQNIDNQDRMVAVGLQTEQGTLSGERIREIITSKGGYLNSYDFDSAEPSQSELTEYAIQEIGDNAYRYLGATTQEIFESYKYIYTLNGDQYEPATIWNASTEYYVLDIWDKTRVINLYNENQPDTWSWDLNSEWWSNLGFIGVVSDGNNYGLHGLVTGSSADYKVSIDNDVTMSVNGLPELAQTVAGQIINQQSNAEDKAYSAKYTDQHFAPLSFVSKLYLEKNTITAANLVNDPPTVANNNYLSGSISSDTISWSNPLYTVTRTLQAATTLSNENSFTLNLNFKVNRNCNLAFGAKVKVSQDNGTTWTYIGDNQSYGETDYTADVLSAIQLIVYTNLLTASTSYQIGDLVAIELFAQLGTGDSTLTTIDTYCGVTINNSDVFSYARFNFSSMMISSDQIADGSITYPKLDNNLQGKIDSIAGKQEQLISGTNIKSVNNNSLLGSGNLVLGTYQAFPAAWTTDSTTKALCDDVNADVNAVVGMAYLGGVTFSDLPFNGNGDLVVEVMQGPNSSKAIHLILTSGNIAPYRWEYTYWNNGDNTSGWKSFISSDNIDNTPTQNSTNVVSSGGVYTALAEYAKEALIAPEYDNASTYDQGDLVIYDNLLYSCNQAITVAESWTAAHWTLVNISDLLVLKANNNNVVTLDTNMNTFAGDKTLNFADNSHLYLKEGNNTTPFDISIGNTYSYIQVGGSSGQSLKLYRNTMSSRAPNHIGFNYKPTLSIYQDDYWIYLPYKSGTILLANSIFPEFSSSSAYVSGAYVTYTGKLYRCTAASVPAGNWNASNWTEVTIQDLLNAKQETLVSGNNLKTINNESLLGSGNLTIGTPSVIWWGE